MTTALRELTPDEQAAFRKDYQDKESEINRYIAVYLSAIAVVTGWLIGPQSKTIVELVTGNNGYNLFGWYAILFINIVFSCFLAYKGLIIHDVMQFVTFTAPDQSAFVYWEAWRRSKYSATKRVRAAYATVIAAVPILVALILMWVLRRFLAIPAEDWASWASKARQAAQTSNVNPLTPIDLNQLRAALHLAQGWWWGMLLLHLIPIWFFAESIGPTNWRWHDVLKARPTIPDFDKRYPTSLAAPAITTALSMPVAGPPSNTIVPASHPDASLQTGRPAPGPTHPDPATGNPEDPPR
jgi:hypothetical protein